MGHTTCADCYALTIEPHPRGKSLVAHRIPSYLCQPPVDEERRHAGTKGKQFIKLVLMYFLIMLLQAKPGAHIPEEHRLEEEEHHPEEEGHRLEEGHHPEEDTLEGDNLVEDSPVEGHHPEGDSLVAGSPAEDSLAEGSPVGGSLVEGSLVGDILAVGSRILVGDNLVEGSHIVEDSPEEDSPVGDILAVAPFVEVLHSHDTKF